MNFFKIIHTNLKNRFFSRSSYVWQYFFSQHKTKIGMLVLLLLCGISISGCMPHVFGKLIDSLTASNINDTFMFLVIYTGIGIMSWALQIIENRLGELLIVTINNDVRKNIFSKVLFSTSSQRDKYPAGEIINRIENDCSNIISHYLNMISTIITILLNAIISLLYLVNISPFCALVSIANIPIMLLINFSFHRKVKSIEKCAKSTNDSRMSFLHIVAEHYKSIKIFNVEQSFKDYYSNFIKKEYDNNKSNINVANVMSVLRNSSGNAINFVLLYFFAQFIANGNLTIGSMVSFNTYASRLIGSITSFMSMNMDSARISVSIERIKEIQQIEQEPIRSETSNQKLVINKINFFDASFGYGNTNQLHHFFLKIDNPGLYSLVGKNGCGKSTLFRLMLKLYTLSEGSYELNGINSEYYRINDIRRSIVYASQDEIILNDSIKNNLLVVCKTASQDEIISAVKQACFFDDIMAFSNQFDTLLGANGVLLSNGQKQKLSFARSLLRKGSVYLFDEITSDIDGSAEFLIYSKIKQLALNNIVIHATHKASLLKESNHIFVFENGKIEQQGTFEKLLESSHLFRELFY